MRHLLAMTLLAALAAPALAEAHVGVRPRESKAGAEEHYTVRVPTEGSVTTTSVRFVLPDGVTVLDVPKPEIGSVELKKEGDRIVEIVWTRNIEPKETGEFTFHARNPDRGEAIYWKAHQMFADGTSADWVMPPGAGGRPGPVTKLLPSIERDPGLSPHHHAGREAVRWLQPPGHYALMVTQPSRPEESV